MDTADFPPGGAMATLRGREPTESVLFIGTQFSNLYTAVDTPAKGHVGVIGHTSKAVLR